MLNIIKKRLDQELHAFIASIEKTYSLRRISPLLFESIKEFVLRDGKRIRPILLIVGYRGYAQRPSRHYVRSALALELLHDFLLVHDDIVDKSPTRRGKPTMHVGLNRHLAKHNNLKFSGEDLSIIIGDVMYAIAIDAFLSIQEKPDRKERALRNFIGAAILTGGGEFIELLSGIKPLRQIQKSDIYNIYDYKTAHYTFACPLSTGAILAGARKDEINKLYNYGMNLGRAFQIKDDILGVFGDEKQIGKSTLSDLQEAKKTILIWHAFHNGGPAIKQLIQKVFSKKRLTRNDLTMMQNALRQTGALDFARKEIHRLSSKAQDIIHSSHIKTRYKKFLIDYCRRLLSL